MRYGVFQSATGVVEAFTVLLSCVLVFLLGNAITDLVMDGTIIEGDIVSEVAFSPSTVGFNIFLDGALGLLVIGMMAD